MAASKTSKFVALRMYVHHQQLPTIQQLIIKPMKCCHTLIIWFGIACVWQSRRSYPFRMLTVEQLELERKRKRATHNEGELEKVKRDGNKEERTMWDVSEGELTAIHSLKLTCHSNWSLIGISHIIDFMCILTVSTSFLCCCFHFPVVDLECDDSRWA